jgi:hypothetical protein
MNSQILFGDIGVKHGYTELNKLKRGNIDGIELATNFDGSVVHPDFFRIKTYDGEVFCLDKCLIEDEASDLIEYAIERNREGYDKARKGLDGGERYSFRNDNPGVTMSVLQVGLGPKCMVYPIPKSARKRVEPKEVEGSISLSFVEESMSHNKFLEQLFGVRLRDES